MTRLDLAHELSALAEKCVSHEFSAVAGVLFSLAGHVVMGSELIALDAITPTTKAALAEIQKAKTPGSIQ